MKYANDLRYKYLFLDAWTTFEIEQKDTWNASYYIIYKAKQPVGYIKWNLNTTTKIATENGLFILPEYWGYEIPMVALKRWADALLLNKKCNKLVMSCIPENKHLYAILKEASKIGLREVGIYKQHTMTSDFILCDMAKFELLREDYIYNLDKVANE